MEVLNYPEEDYLACGFYGDMEEDEVRCYRKKMVKARKEHECAGCGREIGVGEYAMRESGFMDGASVSSYTCAECLEDWMRESGQIEEDEE